MNKIIDQQARGKDDRDNGMLSFCHSISLIKSTFSFVPPFHCRKLWIFLMTWNACHEHGDLQNKTNIRIQYYFQKTKFMHLFQHAGYAIEQNICRSAWMKCNQLLTLTTECMILSPLFFCVSSWSLVISSGIFMSHEFSTGLCKYCTHLSISVLWVQ